MKLRDIMSENVLKLSEGQTASDSFALMRDAGVRHAVVTTAGCIVGLLSERDLGGANGGAVRKSRFVRDLMCPRVFTAPPDMGIDEAAIRMRQHHIGCLPVVDGRRLVGIVTRGDLLEALAFGRRRSRRTARAGDADLVRPPPMPSPHHFFK
jgi:acetoin utilization protein AcuB